MINLDGDKVKDNADSARQTREHADILIVKPE